MAIQKKATSGINILSSPIQEKEGIQDSEKLLYEDTMKSGKDLNNPNLVSTLIEDSHSLYSFFIAFSNKLKETSQIKILCNATVSEIVTDKDNKKIVGLKYYLNVNKDNLIKSIVLSTGGFGSDFYSNDSLLKELSKDKSRFPTTDAVQTQGLYIKMQENLV